MYSLRLSFPRRECVVIDCNRVFFDVILNEVKDPVESLGFFAASVLNKVAQNDNHFRICISVMTLCIVNSSSVQRS